MTNSAGKVWTLDDVRALEFWPDELFDDGTVTFEAPRRLCVRGKHWRLGEPCTVCGLPTGAPEPAMVRGWFPCYHSSGKKYCSKRCTQRAYRERKRLRARQLIHECLQCGSGEYANGRCVYCSNPMPVSYKIPARNCAHCAGAIPPSRRADVKFCSGRCRQAVHRKALRLGEGLHVQTFTTRNGPHDHTKQAQGGAA